MNMDFDKRYQYEVYHPDAADFGFTVTPKYATWPEALAAQVKFNKDCPGHIARKRSNTMGKDNTSCNTIPKCCRNCKHYDWDILAEGFGEHLRGCNLGVFLPVRKQTCKRQEKITS